MKPSTDLLAQERQGNHRYVDGALMNVFAESTIDPRKKREEELIAADQIRRNQNLEEHLRQRNSNNPQAGVGSSGIKPSDTSGAEERSRELTYGRQDPAYPTELQDLQAEINNGLNEGGRAFPIRDMGATPSGGASPSGQQIVDSGKPSPSSINGPGVIAPEIAPGAGMEQIGPARTPEMATAPRAEAGAPMAGPAPQMAPGPAPGAPGPAPGASRRTSPQGKPRPRTNRPSDGQTSTPGTKSGDPNSSFEALFSEALQKAKSGDDHARKALETFAKLYKGVSY